MLIVDSLLRFFAYILMILGIVFVSLPLLTPYYNKKKLKKEFHIRKCKKKSKNIIYIKINRFINTVFSEKAVVEVFLLIEIVIIFLTFLFVFSLSRNILSSLFISILTALLPVAFLEIKLHMKRVECSYEGEKFIVELLSQYKVSCFNIIDALDKTVCNLDGQPNIKKGLIKLCYRVKEYKSTKELNEIIYEFTYSINTNWSILLGNCIYFAIEYEENVVTALEDLLDEIREIKTLIEKDKQFNNESFVLIKYIMPGSYLFSIFAVIKFFDFSISKLILYQINTEIGLKMFLLIIIFMILNFSIYFTLRKPKYDI